MRHSSRVPLVAGLLALSTSVLLSQEPVDLGVVDRIKDEAFARSEVMDHLRNLTDVHGPRLTGSPEFEEAAQWAVERLSQDRGEQRARGAMGSRSAGAGRSKCSRPSNSARITRV